MTFDDLQQILEKHSWKNKHFLLYRGERVLVPFTPQKAVISLRAITAEVLAETCYLHSPVLRGHAQRWKWPRPCFYLKGNYTSWFLIVQKSHLCFDVPRYTPITSLVPLNWMGGGQCIFPQLYSCLFGAQSINLIVHWSQRMLAVGK